jgi:hypothetical protein
VVILRIIYFSGTANILLQFLVTMPRYENNPSKYRHCVAISHQLVVRRAACQLPDFTAFLMVETIFLYIIVLQI